MYWRSLSLIAILLVILILIKGPMNIYAHEKIKNLNTKCTLPDIIHDHIPAMPKLGKIADVVAVNSIAISIIFFIFVRFKTAIVFSIFYIVLTLFCSVYYIITILPDSNNGNCIISKNLYETVKNKGSNC